jgi:hypothetical protein
MPYICKRQPCTSPNCPTKTQLIYNGEYRCFDHNPDKQKEKVHNNCLYFKTDTGREIINRLNRERYHRMKQACAEEEARILLEAQKYQYVHNPMQSALPTHTLEETANFEKTTIMVRSQ